MVASDHSCLFMVGGVLFPRDFYFAWKQFVRKRCAHQEIPFEINLGILHKHNSQLLHALTLWMTAIITPILFHEQLWPLEYFSVSRYFWQEQIICVPHKPITFSAHDNARAIIWD